MSAQTNTEGGVPFYKIGTIGGKADAYISKDLFDEYKMKYSFPHKGEVMITCAGTVGKCIIYNGEDSYYQDSNIVWIDNPNNIISNDFLYHLLSQINWSHLNSTTIARIYNDDLRNLKLYYPQHDEQKKITHFLSLINERIATQNKVIDKLQSLIRGLYSKLFQSSTNKNCYHLGEISALYQPATISSAELNNGGKYLVYGANGIIGKYDKYNHEFPQITITCRGNTCGTVNFTSNHCWITGNSMVVNIEKFAATVDQRYLFHYLNKMDFSSIISGSGQPQIVRTPLEKLKIYLPALSEQQKISANIDTILTKLTLEQSVLGYFQQQKNFLLQQMFI